MGQWNQETLRTTAGAGGTRRGREALTRFVRETPILTAGGDGEGGGAGGLGGGGGGLGGGGGGDGGEDGGGDAAALPMTNATEATRTMPGVRVSETAIPSSTVTPTRRPVSTSCPAA